MGEELRILILDDTAADAELEVRELRKEMASSTIQVVDTKDGFVKALREFSPDIILSDNSMPSYDGISAMRAAMELCPDVPFVFVSGAIEEDVAIEALKTGATDYVFKNHLVRLVPVVRRALREAVEARERRAAEEALVISEELYRTLFESSRDALMTLAAPSWGFTSCNASALQLFRVSDEEQFTSLGPWDLSTEFQPVGGPSADKAKAMLETALREGFFEFEWTHRRLDGEEFPADVLLTRMEMGGETVVQASVRDITERKAAEEALAESKAALERQAQELKDLITVAAHELRHPATVFRGYANILLASWEELDADTIRDALSAIDKATDRLTSLVVNLLDTSVIESGKLILSLSESDPRAPVRRAVEEARARGLENEFRVSLEDMYTTRIDVERLRHVISILLENAVKFSPEGSTIDISCIADESCIIYSVADHGIGILEDDEERVFGRFYQVEDASHHSLPGMGLGLYMARTIVEAHGGWIKVDARSNGGSVFSFGIPAKSSSEP